MNQNQQTGKAIDDLTFDWVTIVQKKAKAIAAYDKYIRDAQQAQSTECVRLMEQIRADDQRHLEQAMQHLKRALSKESNHRNT